MSCQHHGIGILIRTCKFALREFHCMVLFLVLSRIFDVAPEQAGEKRDRLVQCEPEAEAIARQLYDYIERMRDQ